MIRSPPKVIDPDDSSFHRNPAEQSHVNTPLESLQLVPAVLPVPSESSCSTTVIVSDVASNSVPSGKTSPV